MRHGLPRPPAHAVSAGSEEAAILLSSLLTAHNKPRNHCQKSGDARCEASGRCPSPASARDERAAGVSGDWLRADGPLPVSPDRRCYFARTAADARQETAALLSPPPRPVASRRLRRKSQAAVLHLSGRTADGAQARSARELWERGRQSRSRCGPMTAGRSTSFPISWPVAGAFASWLFSTTAPASVWLPWPIPRSPASGSPVSSIF